VHIPDLVPLVPKTGNWGELKVTISSVTPTERILD